MRLRASLCDPSVCAFVVLSVFRLVGRWDLADRPSLVDSWDLADSATPSL